MRDRFQDAKDTVGMIEIMIQNQLKQNDMMKQELEKQSDVVVVESDASMTEEFANKKKKKKMASSFQVNS